jgi:Cu(I)/Ag(I) efflux system membrane fusion protein
MGMGGDNDMVEILDGLAPGETVVTSGQFLMDVESRTIEATQKLK